MTNELLLHAKLYCFADRYAIPTLADLCMDHLRLSLINCECQSNQVQGIAKLLTFAANNTRPLDDDDTENMRSVVLSFAVIVFELIVEDTVF